MDQKQMNPAAQPQRQAAPGAQQQRPAAQGAHRAEQQQRPAPGAAQRPMQAGPQQRSAQGAPTAHRAEQQQRPAPGAAQRPMQAGPQQRSAQGAPTAHRAEQQQRPAAQRRPEPQGQQPAAQDGVEKQLIVRMFQPDMPLLKATAKQLSGMQNVKLGMYGQSGEVLVVIAARARTMAAATELTENAAAQLEAAMRDTVYARGKAPLSAVSVSEMHKDEATMAASDDATGRLLETELQSVQGADKVFDFGQNSFRNPRMADKIADAALMDDEESGDPIQLSADRSFAARKCTKVDFGVCVSGLDGGKTVCAAITYGKTVYVRCIRPAPDAAKAAALSVFDMIRRLTLGMEIPYARAFKAGQEIDWNEPLQQKASGKSNAKGGKTVAKGSKNMLVPIIMLLVVAIALGVGIWYVVTTFIIKDEGNVPAGNGVSMADSAVVSGGEQGAQGSASTPQATPDSVAQPVDSGAPVVHPFA